MSNFPKWCLFFDFHTMPANPDVGKGFDFESITNRFVAAGVQYVVFPARCNLGTAYYDTKLGIRHPALTYDMLPKFVEACHRKGIRFSAYVNAGLSHEEGLRHRDWLVMTKNGEIYHENRLNSFFRQMCYNTAYGDHLVAMVQEIITHCGVDGIFLDCFHTPPCYGYECVEAMKKEGIDLDDAEAVEAFNLRKLNAQAKRISKAAKAIKPDIMIYFNGIGFEDQAECGTYLEFECLPTGGWGYECLPFGCRYLRTLGKPVLNMTGRFHRSWGDFGGIRTEASLEYDCIYGLANGLATTIGDHFHPRGDINRAVADLDTRLYNKLQKLDPWLEEAKPVTEIAVPMLHPYPGYDCLSPKKQPVFQKNYNAVRGATRMLCELKQQFDLPSHFAGWDKYDVLVLPDFVEMDDETRKRVQAHLAKGGRIIASAWSGLNPQKDAFAFPDWGVEYQGDDPFDPAFFNPAFGFREGFPEMPMNFYEKGVQVRAKEGTEVLGTICAPYYNEHWDGEQGFVYLPPNRDTGRPAVTFKGQVAYISHPIFSSYFNWGSLPCRQIFEKLLNRMLPRPLVRTPGAPSFTRATVTEQPGRRMVYFLSYLPEQRGAHSNMIEEPLLVTDQKIMLRQDGVTYKRAYLAPSGEALPLFQEDGYATVVLSKSLGWSVIVFEE